VPNAILALGVLAIAVADRRRRRSPSAVLAVLRRRGVLGVTLVLPIGGADMPVVISTLNAFTGLSRRRPASRWTTRR
jgi:NAD(P) transhydrogenase subunit beta